MRILIDCTSTYTTGLNSGIQRVVRNFLRHATALGPSMNVDCTPVIFKNGAIFPLAPLDVLSLHAPRSPRVDLNRIYRNAAVRVAALLPFPPFQRFLFTHRSRFGMAWILFSPLRVITWLRSSYKPLRRFPKGIECTLGKDDILFLPDVFWSDSAFQRLATVKKKNGLIVFFIHDIIPLTHPSAFPPDHVERFRKWFLQVTQTADLLVCNSRFTQQSVITYIKGQPGMQQPPSIVIPLGHDLCPQPTGNIHHDKLCRALKKSRAAFLCVGTLEPRKDLPTLIDAFETLWDDKLDVSLIIIGRAGWLCETLIYRILQHPERNRRLFWFNDVGDTDLALAYKQSSALIFPSIVEGFGLPLVEALSQGLPVIASDIPVFREIAENRVHYFLPHNASALAGAVRAHLATPSEDVSPTFQWPTWEESTRLLLIALHTFCHKRSDRD